MEVNSVSPSLNSTVGSVESSSFEGLGSNDFLKLLIAQLANQDPLEPTGNEELLQQISSIREIELSATLTDSLRQLTGQQQSASVSALLGQYVTGKPGPDGIIDAGVVVGVRFGTDGLPLLQLSSGGELAIDQVATIESTARAAEALIGKTVVGVDQRDASDPEVVEGVVTAVQVDQNDEVLLELDTGEDLRFRDFISLAAAAT